MDKGIFIERDFMYHDGYIKISLYSLHIIISHGNAYTMKNTILFVSFSDVRERNFLFVSFSEMRERKSKR